MKYFSQMFAVACAGLLAIGSAQAQDMIEGTYVPATESNTSVVGGGVILATWNDSAETVNGELGFNPTFAASTLVTSVSGLNPGDVYNVAAVYTNLTFFMNTNIAAGLTPDNLITVPTPNPDELTDLTSSRQGVGVYDINLGPQTVDEDGNLNVFVSDGDTDFAGFFLAYHGITMDFVSSASVLGDFDENNIVNCDDLDGYIGNIDTSVAEITGGLANLDIDLDETLSLADANSTIADLVVTSNGITGTFPGDFNCDGTVDVLNDAFALVNNLGGTVTSYAQGDATFDGDVDVLADAFTLINNLGSTNEAPAAP